MTELKVVERRRHPDFPGSVDYELGPAGRDLIGVVRVLQAWLAESPEGPLQPGSPAAKSAIKALIEGWSSTIVRAIAARPFSLTELNQLISSLNYPSLERRLCAMRLAGQIEPSPSGGRSRPYVATNWLRRAIAPLATAANWERRHAPAEGAPVSRLDIESALLLTVPMLCLPPDLSGVCRIAVEARGADGETLFGVMARIDGGRVASCVARLCGDAEAWVAGSTHDWTEALRARDAGLLELGGDRELARAVVESLPHALFGVRMSSPA